MMGREKQSSHSWQVWLAVWSASVISLVAILLYVLILDIDPPSIKPRTGVENSAAAIVYIAHCGNIIASFVVSFGLMREEYSLLAIYLMWELVYCVLVIVLIPLTVFTVLKHIPGRIILHIICFLIGVWDILTIFRIYRNRDRYDWNPRPASKPRPSNNEYNGHNNRMTGETGML